MKYWKRWIADFSGKTGGCSLAEIGAYDRLLDEYYAHEQPLPTSKVALYRICAAMSAPERRAVDAVVARFFIIGEDGKLHNTRADAYLVDEIAFIGDQRERGKLGAARRWKKTDGLPEVKPKSNGDATHKEKPRVSYIQMSDWELMSKANAMDIPTAGLSREQLIAKLIAKDARK